MDERDGMDTRCVQATSEAVECLSSTFAILMRLETPCFPSIPKTIGDFLHDIVFSRLCKKLSDAYFARISQYVTQSKMAEVELRGCSACGYS